MRNLGLQAADGFPLAASAFEPTRTQARAAVLIAPATGVLRRYYRSFAEYLTELGMHVLTFDYRGIGESRPSSLRGFEATMTEWAERDVEGALLHLRREFPDLPLGLVGHSFGGQGLGIVPSVGEVRAAALIATQSGYWKHFRAMGRLQSWSFWHLLLPGLSRLFGYFPAKALRFSEDLPAGVALEWASWGRHPDYLLRVPGRQALYANLELPILVISFEDDTYAPFSSVRDLLSRFPNTDLEHLHLEPGDIGATEVGHFGFFRKRFRETLWPLVGDWLEIQL